MWAAAGQAVGVGLPMLIEVLIMIPHAPEDRYKPQDLMFPLLGFSLALVPSLLSIDPISLIWNGTIPIQMYHCILEVNTSVFEFIGFHSKKFALGLRRDSGFGSLKNGCQCFYFEDS
jgi:hypothetical protein